MWRGGSGFAATVAPFSCGGTNHDSRFHIPLSEPSRQFSCTRLSNKDAHAFAHARLGVNRQSRTTPFDTTTDGAVEWRGIDFPVGFADGTRFEIVGFAAGIGELQDIFAVPPGRTAGRTETRGFPSLWHVTPFVTSEHSAELIACPISRSSLLLASLLN